ncbi:class I SAM-dependent methyltransferase [Lacticaseibacillus jixiensis]|uniref:class I SAM-dependent methyltransferase n=1 Tax=Lacticaseibacillus jixiensis TaxID=3231926 RepID=UPI0036F41FF4
MNQAEWNEFAATYAAIQRESQLPIEQDVVAALATRYPLADWRVADVAAGSGRYTLPLAQRAKQVVAIDWAQAMLDEARTWLNQHEQSNVTYQQGDWHDRVSPIAELVFVSQLPTLTADELPQLAGLATRAVAINSQIKWRSTAQSKVAKALSWALPTAYQADPQRVQNFQHALTISKHAYHQQTFTYTLLEETTPQEVLASFERPYTLTQANTTAQVLGAADAQAVIQTTTTYAYTLLDWPV